MRTIPLSFQRLRLVILKSKPRGTAPSWITRNGNAKYLRIVFGWCSDVTRQIHWHRQIVIAGVVRISLRVVDNPNVPYAYKPVFPYSS